MEVTKTLLDSKTNTEEQASKQILKYLKQFIYIVLKKLSRVTMTINWVDSNLAIGDIADVTLRDQLRQHGIEMIIDIRLYFTGSGDTPPLPSIWKAANEVLKLSETNKILIYCQAGIDRSPFFAMLYYKLKHGCDYPEAYDYIQQKRPQTIQHWEWVEMIKQW